MKLSIYDTTLRDGAQREGISFSVDDKLRIARRLDRLGVDYIEGGWPGANPKDSQFFETVRGFSFAHARLVAFGSTCRPGNAADSDAGLAALLAAQTPAVAIFGKSWDFHVIEALKTTLDENLRMIADSVAFFNKAGREVIYDAEHFFDGFKHNPEYALATLRAAHEAGAAVLVLCDTNGGSLPGQVSAAVARVKAELPSAVIGIHAHNDSGLAVAVSIAAVEAGASQVQGTMNGLGERCGNADLCTLMPVLQLKMGFDCIPPEEMSQLSRASRFVAEIANLPSLPGQPFVGAQAFAHKGGIHVSALLRHPETYEHLRPELVGNERRVIISDQAGLSNVLYKAGEYGLELAKSAPETRVVLDIVKDLEHQGYSFEGAEGSFELLLKKSLGLHRPFFELVEFRLLIEKREEGRTGVEPIAQATVKLKVFGETVHTVAEGDGPVNALDTALRKALMPFYPQLAEIRLTDFKVRVLDESAGTAATVRVLIESANHQRSWGTVGVSTNLIEASWRALVDSIEYGLMVTAPAEGGQVDAGAAGAAMSSPA